VEQANKFQQYDLTRDVNGDSVNTNARNQDIPFYVCPSDGSQAVANGNSGRCNYMASIGNWPNPNNADANAISATAAVAGGMFFTEFTTNQWGVLLNRPRSVKMKMIQDGTSNTAMWGEIKRGFGSGSQNGTTTPYDPALVAWDANNATIAASSTPTGGCAMDPATVTSGTVYRYAGNEYYRSFVITCFYTHTKVPNSPVMDCTDTTSGHIGSRSYHSGGVNNCFADGSVHFIADGIDLTTWQAIGTRAAGEVFQYNF
jgi:prepilin-type processing-associated H-X9-DG protein